MHELSVAHAVVATVAEAAAAATEPGAVPRVTVVRVRVGALSGVVPSALTFAFDVAAAGTVVEGAALEITEVPVRVHCEPCGEDVTLPTTTRFRCPTCDTPTAAIVGGRELEIESIAVVDAPVAGDTAPGAAVTGAAP